MKSRKLSRLLFSACFSLLAVSAPARQLPGADPFRGLYKNWKGRMTPQQEQRRRHRQLVEDVVKACPRSSAADIRKFMSLFESESAISGFFGGASAKPCTEPWAEAVRSVRLVASGKFRDGITAMRALAERLPPGDILRTHLFMMELAAQKAGTPAHREIERKLIADIEAAVLSGKYRGSSIYLFYYNTLAQSDDCGSRYWGEFAQRLNPVADRVDPWFLAMIRGRAAVFWAWESRGARGYAQSTASFNLEAGAYVVEIVYFNRGGGRVIDFSAAEGRVDFDKDVFSVVGTEGCPVVHGGALLGQIAADVKDEMLGKETMLAWKTTFNMAEAPAANDSFRLLMR